MNEEQLVPYNASALPDVSRILVLAPHPDDEVFGCGGSLALYSQRGADIQVVIVTNGAGAGDPALRLSESCNAAQVLGYPPPVCWHLEDRSLQYGEQIVVRIVDALTETNAQLVYAPSLWENHPDHRVIALAVIEAVRRRPLVSLAQYEIGAPLRPNLLIDITPVLEKKRTAMACFTSQLALQRYDEHIDALNRFRTFTLSPVVLAAEACEYYSAKVLEQGHISFMLSEYQRQHSNGLMSLPDDSPLVSVLVRSMDRPSLEATLSSVAAQTWPKVEVVVINAAGPQHRDLTSWCGRFPLRQIASHQKLNRSCAANLALDHARGEYLLFLDDDDQIASDHISKLAAYFEENHQARIVYTETRGVNAQGVTLINFKINAPRCRLLLGNFIPIHSVLFHSEVIGAECCRFDETLDIYEDWDFWLRATKNHSLHFVAGASAIYHLNQSADHPVHNVQVQRESSLQILAKWQSEWIPEVMLEIRTYIEGIEQQCLEKNIELEFLKSERQQILQNHQQLLGDHQQLVGDHQQLKNQLAQLKCSRSWRITAPLRIIVTWLRAVVLRKNKKINTP